MDIRQNARLTLRSREALVEIAERTTSFAAPSSSYSPVFAVGGIASHPSQGPGQAPAHQNALGTGAAG